MKALISPNEPRETGYRVAEVSAQSFEVAEPLFWLECASDVVADQFWYDPADNAIKVIPDSEPLFIQTASQPTVDGAETL